MNKNVKIVVFCFKELTQRTIDELALDELSKCYDLEYWNCRAISYPADPPRSLNKVVNRPYVRNIRNFRDLKKSLQQLPNDTIGVIWLLKNRKMLRAHQAIAAKIACAVIYALNFNDSSAGILMKDDTLEDEMTNESYESISKNRKCKCRGILRGIKHKLYQNEKLYLICKFLRYKGGQNYYNEEMRIYSGKCLAAYKKIYRMGVSPDADFRTCHPDYDKILKLGTEVKYKEPYFVYVDESYMDSLDAINRFPNVDLDVLRQSYYESINKFFDMVENEYKCKIKIALHPNAFRAEYPFNGRECYQYRTVELVKDCKGVILHASNAINFIAYYDKPICYVYNDVLSKFNFKGSLYTLGAFQCQQLNLPFVKMEELQSAAGIFHKLQPEIRQAVVNKYFGDISRGIPNSEILKEHLNTIYNLIKTE